jgi:hypothetical protein
MAALTTVVLAARSSESQPKPETASDVISSLGVVPIPSASTGALAPVTASVGHPQLVAMGAPVQVSLPGNVQALLTTSGPASDTPPGGAKPDSAVKGTITVTVRPSSGSVRLPSATCPAATRPGPPSP